MYKPPETTKAEMIQAVAEAMQIGKLIRSPDFGRVTKLNEQLGKLKSLADYLPESKENIINKNQQLQIAFGKYIAGYRPGDELWSDLDQWAFDIAREKTKKEL
jgi:hypothetical protein